MRFTLSLLTLSYSIVLILLFIFFLLIFVLFFITLFLIRGFNASFLPILRHPNLKFPLKFPDPLLISFISFILGLWIRYDPLMLTPPNLTIISIDAVNLYFLLNERTNPR